MIDNANQQDPDIEKSDKDSQDLEINEPDEREPLNSSYGGEIEIWKPFRLNLEDFSGRQLASPEAMRQLLTRWLLRRFDLYMALGVIALILLRNVEPLIAFVSSTGLFGILFFLVYKHYFFKKR